MTRQRDPRITLFNIKKAGGRIEGYIDGQDYTAYVESVGQGISERRITFGPGYRIYFGRDGETLVVLLTGGTKMQQS